ncbi:MAG TPA: NUDIX hydrolase [Symbiobacteriaceae bacterium]|nr:NUDIX hydrolase [Symbiobacteriaceae bacterium]
MGGCVRRLAVGAVLLNEKGQVLLVRNRGHYRPHWSLPKGSCEEGEPLLQTMGREVLEETGLVVEMAELAFVTEWFVASRQEWYLQFYFHATVVGGELGVPEDDEDVTQVQWVHPKEIRQYMNYRPWVEPLFTWLEERRPRYHIF